MQKDEHLNLSKTEIYSHNFMLERRCQRKADVTLWDFTLGEFWMLISENKILQAYMHFRGFWR